MDSAGNQLAHLRPRLLLAGNFLSGAGKNRSSMEELAVRLHERGYPLVTASHFQRAWLRGAHMNAVAVFRRKRYDLGLVDVFSGRRFAVGESMSLLLSAIDRPLILVLRGGALVEFAARWPLRVRACLRRASAVVSPSRFLAQHLRPYRDDIEVVPNAIDLAAHPFVERQSPGFRLVWLRAFHQFYDPEIAVEVLGALSGEFPGLHLTMIGPDSNDGSSRKVRALAARLGVTDRLRIMGGVRKADVPHHLASSDIFLNTTRFESFGVSLLEAAASGVPIVSTDVGEIPYLWENERDALLVPSRSASMMIAAVRRLLREPELSRALATNARKKAERFDWSMTLPTWEALLQRTDLRRGAKPA